MFQNKKIEILILLIALCYGLFAIADESSKVTSRSSTPAPSTIIASDSFFTEMTKPVDMTDFTMVTDLTDVTFVTEEASVERISIESDSALTDDKTNETENGETENGETENGETENGEAENGETDNGETEKGETEKGETEKGKRSSNLRTIKRDSTIAMRWENKAGVNENIKNSKISTSKLYDMIYLPVGRWTTTFGNRRFDSKENNFFLVEGGRNGYGFYGIFHMKDLIFSGALDEGSKLYLNFDRIGGRMSLPIRVDIVNSTEDFTVSNNTINGSMIIQSFKAILPRWTGYSSQVDITDVLKFFAKDGKYFDLHVLISTPSLSRFGEFSTFNRTDSTGFSMIALGNSTIYDKYIHDKSAGFNWWYILLGLAGVVIIGGIIYFCCAA